MDHDVDEPWSRVSPRVLLLGALLLSALVYLPTLTFDFVYDDHWTILANGFRRMPGDLPLLLGPRAHAANVPDAFRPTLVAFDMASYQLLGVDAWRHHAASVLLHVGVVACLVAWLRGLRAPPAVWAASAALFGVMAIHAEAVTVVSFHEDLLAAAFGLGALALADRSGAAVRASSTVLLAAIAGVLVLLAAGAKLNAVTMLGLWALARWLAPWGRPFGRRDLPAALALAVGVGLALAHQWSIHGGPSPYPEDDPRLALVRHGHAAVLARSAQIHVAYVQQLLLPFGLSPEYVERPDTWSSPGALAAAAVLLGLVAVGLWAAWRRRAPVLALAVLGAMGLALPTSNLWPMPNLRADRLMYVPSIAVAVGLGAALVAAGRAWARRARPEHASVRAVVPLVAMLVLQGALAQGASTSYRSDTRLWDTALRHAPASARAHAVRGELYVAQLGDGRSPDLRILARASTHCRIAQWLDPDQALPWLCEARLAAAQRDWPRAYDRLQRALAIGMPLRDRALASLASIALDHPDHPYAERVAEARELADRAIREYPYSALAPATAAGIPHRLGDAERARELYARASELRPERWDLVLAGVELELDLGHASAARAAWAAHEDLLEAADPARRDHVRRRLADAERLLATGRDDP
jgi:tetratricopeptide (TPR) repeat protein